MTCEVCNQHPAVVGVICSACQAKLVGSLQLAPEQILLDSERPSNAALIDLWGRVHRLDLGTHIGRVVDGPTLRVLTPTVSRTHALIMRDEDQWYVSELGSSNGTFVNDERVSYRHALPDLAHVRFGKAAFYFLPDATRIASAKPARAISKTIRHPSEGESSRSALELTAPIPRAEVTFELQQPTGGGGALALIDGKPIQLSVAQLDLVKALVERMLAQTDADEESRGYVSIEQLLQMLSLESSEADTDNVRQLVRRVRKRMVEAGVGDLIESRHGRGYRLRVLPWVK